MPITIQPATLKVKKQNGQYQSADCLKGDKGDPGSVGIIAPDYADLTFPVAQGQPCIHEGLYYIANSAIQSSESWTAAHWTQLTVGEQVTDVLTAIQGVDDALIVDKNFLDSSEWTSQTNYAVTNNGDGTYTFGTSDYGSVFWESIGDVPAGKYKIPGSEFGFVTVSTSRSYTEDVIIKNDTGSDVEFTNPAKQHLFFCLRTMAAPSRQFIFSPWITQKVVKIQEEIDDLNGAKLVEKTENIVDAIGHKRTKTGNCVTMDSVVGQVVVDTTTANGTAFICGNNLLNINWEGIVGTGADTLSTIVNRWITDRKYTKGVYVNDDTAEHTVVYNPFVTAVAPVIPGVTYYMSVADTFSRYYILDDEMNIVGGASSSWKSNYSFTAPANAKYLVTSFKRDTTFVYCGIRKERGEFAEIVTATDGIPVTPNCKDIMVFAPNGESVSVTAFIYDENATENQKELDTARFVSGGNVIALTILHISDIHGDSDTIARIIEKASAFTGIDEMICTGDMVADTYEQITSWWPSDMLTCMGNHDTASYSSGAGYNWTALSMANRDAYYIAPFESSWGITHTSGKSYYYKDYAEQKVRLIVMDGMLYTDNGADATAQTAWMEDLLDDAIDNNLHVLIAIHAPHGGATSVDCSFSESGNSTMPLWNDCNTPQAVIDAVATKITGGLKFIGYLCGHTHHDWIWDAEGNGKQLVYCIACGTNDYPQWKNADIYHNKNSDIFNLVTIDTEHTLVKLIRGGGGDFTNRMKMRKAICFDYSTGEVVGEVL